MTLPTWIRRNKETVYERLRSLDLDKIAQLVDTNAPADLGAYLIDVLEAEKAYQEDGVPADPSPDGDERARQAQAINAEARGPYGKSDYVIRVPHWDYGGG